MLKRIGNFQHTLGKKKKSQEGKEINRLEENDFT